jgi:elongator complex protein 1
MSLHQLKLDYKAVDVAISKTGSRLAVLSDTDIAVYNMDLAKRPVPPPSLLWRSDAISGHVARHVAFLGDEQIYVLTDIWDEEESNLWMSEGEELIFRGPLLEPGRSSSLVTSVDYQKLYVHYQDGALYEVEGDDSQGPSPLQTTLIHKSPSFAPETRVVLFDGKVRQDGLQ